MSTGLGLLLLTPLGVVLSSAGPYGAPAMRTHQQGDQMTHRPRRAFPKTRSPTGTVSRNATTQRNVALATGPTTTGPRGLAQTRRYALRFGTRPGSWASTVIVATWTGTRGGATPERCPPRLANTPARPTPDRRALSRPGRRRQWNVVARPRRGPCTIPSAPETSGQLAQKNPGPLHANLRHSFAQKRPLTPSIYPPPGSRSQSFHQGQRRCWMPPAGGRSVELKNP